MRDEDIRFEELTDDQVLFWIRIRGKKSYFSSVYSESFLSRFSKLKAFRTISEYTRDADVYIDINKFSPHAVTCFERDVMKQCLDELEIIRRCRGLRSISYLKAHDLVVRAARFFINQFRDCKLQLIVMGAVDNYVMDIMCRVARHYGIRCLGVTEFFLAPKYKMVTTYGEHIHFRDPDQEEVVRVHNELMGRLKSVLAISKRRALTQALYDFGSYYYRVVVRYLFKYKLLGCLAYEYRFAPYMAKFRSLRQLAGPGYLKKYDVLNTIECDNAVYLPLHYFPEATVDYWVENSEDANYLESLVSVIRYFSDRGKTVVLKEHPAFYLARPIHFYQAVTAIPNVIILEPFTPTKLVFQKIRDIVVWTGSTGVEAALQGLDVKIVTENYYSNGMLKYYWEDADSVLSHDQQLQMLKRVLQTSLSV